MQSGKDPDYATGKTKRNGTAGTERNRQTRNKTGKPGTQTGNPNRHANETNPQLSVRNTTATGRPETEPANPERNRQTPERNRRYGTQLKDQEQNRQTRYANRKPEPARERNESATVGTEHNCNRQTRNATGKRGTLPAKLNGTEPEQNTTE